MVTKNLADWMRETCQREGLSLRQAAAKANLSHGAIADIMHNSQPTARTIAHLATAFSDGDHHKQALHDELLALAGYRRSRPDVELSQPLARVLDKLSHFTESQLKVVEVFTDFLEQMKAEK